jgi:RNA-binding protein YlmH
MNIVTLISAAQIFGQFRQVQISSRLAYKIMKFCKSASIEEEFYNGKRNELINEYALRDENGQVVVSDEGMVRIVEDKISDANKALTELNGIEVEMPSIKFSLAELEELKLSVEDMFVLDAFIEE